MRQTFRWNELTITSATLLESASSDAVPLPQRQRAPSRLCRAGRGAGLALGGAAGKSHHGLVLKERALSPVRRSSTKYIGEDSVCPYWASIASCCGKPSPLTQSIGEQDVLSCHAITSALALTRVSTAALHPQPTHADATCTRLRGSPPKWQIVPSNMVSHQPRRRYCTPRSSGAHSASLLGSNSRSPACAQSNGWRSWHVARRSCAKRESPAAGQGNKRL